MATKKPTALTWITNEAKRMKKQQPGAKWSNLVKRAGAAYRAKGKSKPKPKARVGKAPVKKRAAKAKVVTTRTASVKRTVGSVSAVLSSARRMLIDKIGRLEARKFEAKKDADKKRIQKEITATKLQARKLM